ncbi:MFS transporter [Sphingomonas sp. UYP23]
MKRWLVLLGCFIGMGVATPALLLQPLGLFLKPVTTEFGWSRTEFSVVLAVAAACNALILPIAGYLVDRFGAPRVAAIGTVLGCCSYAAVSLVHSYGAFIAVLAASVTVGNLASYPAFMGLTQRWFDKRLGAALAVTSTGLAVGVAGFSYLIATNVAVRGWRAAAVIAGFTALIIGLANLAAFVRDNRGPVPEAERRDVPDRANANGATLGAALQSRDFWLFAVSFLLVIFAVVGCNFHLPALLSDRGASPIQIASIVAIGSAGSLFGRLFTGVMLDRYSVRSVAAVFFLGQAIGFLLLLDGLRWALPAGFLLGAVQGAEIDVMGYVVARRFGRQAYARIFGTCFAVMLIGAIVGPIAMGEVFDRTGSYDLGLLVLPIFPVLALSLLWIARVSPPEAPTRKEAAN